MSIDLTGITNKNEYYTNHYFSTVFEENTRATISGWNTAARGSEEIRTPWSLLRQNARKYYIAHDKFVRSYVSLQVLANIKTLADGYLKSLGYPEAKPEMIPVDDSLSVPVYLEMTKSNGAPLLWVLLSASKDNDAGIMESSVFNAEDVDEDAAGALYKGILSEMPNEELVTKILFGSEEAPRFVVLIGMNQIALIDRNKWNEKRYLQFELEEIFSRLENTTLQAMAVLLHKDTLCPDDGKVLLDELDEQSQKNASGVSQDLKYALRESIELLGNEVLYDMKTRQGRDLDADPVDAGQLTLECLRYMYRMLFVLFIEARPELGYAPIKAQSYYSGYSLESLRDIADNVRDDIDEVGGGYYLHETLAKLYELIYDGYPKTEEELKKTTGADSLHDMFVIAPLKAHIFDPEYTKMISAAKLRNSCMLRIIDLMSLTRATGRRNDRRSRISYANLGINQMGAVYEALLSYRGFIAENDLYEVKRAGDKINPLDVGYFVSENELSQYNEDERVRVNENNSSSALRIYEKGTFIYRLAGREREKSASYYTPEVLTKCLVKYALKELLEGKTADEILELTICEPAMGSAAFLNETINQLAEAYISRKEQELGQIISYDKRFNELQKVKMYIADRNVYGIDLNPVAVELAEVSLWLNTIYEGGYVPWFGTQLVNGNSLIGARRQVYRVENVQATSKGLRWYEMEPERVPLGKRRMPKKQIYHFLLGDPGMCRYSDKVIKSLEPDNIKKMAAWSKKFTAPVSDDDVVTLLRLSATIDGLWEAQVNLRKEVSAKTQDSLSVFGHVDEAVDSHTTIRQKDKIFSELYKSEHMKNAGPYARLKFAMDYWCALWFWPIDQVDLLPTRSEFLFDMSLVLEGTTESVVVTDAVTDKKQTRGQLSLFPTEMQQLELDILELYEDYGEVDIPALRKQNPRLDLAARIAEQNHFMHWELEFADLFVERGGFDLVVGNPPWVKLAWDEKAILSETYPIVAIRNLAVSEVKPYRESSFNNEQKKHDYISEYTLVSAEQNFLNAVTNYALLKGQSANLFKCFLPLSWYLSGDKGLCALIHPDGVFDDPKGKDLRAEIYFRLLKHFSFRNEKILFDISHSRIFGLNIYSNRKKHIDFEFIGNLFSPITIDECFDMSKQGQDVPLLKDNNGKWETAGHPDRIIRVTKDELMIFSNLFDGSEDWQKARLPVIHSKQLIYVLDKIRKQPCNIGRYEDKIFFASGISEPMGQSQGVIIHNIHFPVERCEMVYSGAHISVANPFFKTSRRNCQSRYDFDPIDLTAVNKDYFQRCNYEPDSKKVRAFFGKTPWGIDYIDEYRIALRRMLNIIGERSLMPCIIPPGTSYIDTVFGLTASPNTLVAISGVLASVIYDFYVKITSKSDCRSDLISNMPMPDSSPILDAISVRALLLNCITQEYSALLNVFDVDKVRSQHWAKQDERLHEEIFSGFIGKWEINTPLRTDYERRQALVEIDVLTALALGISLNELKAIYRIQFPTLKKNEADTWYDREGKIVFTINPNLPGVGFDRKQFETEIKRAPAGKKFYRTITDDTMPGGPVERTIEYVAPFDSCDREKDYETAWKFFEEKYRK